MQAHGLSRSQEWAAGFLRGALHIENVGRQDFLPGPATEDEIVTTSRLILVVRGELHYTIEGHTSRMSANTQFFVPAWSRRVWVSSPGDPCEIAWCEFDDSEPAFPPPFLQRLLSPASLRLELSSYARMRRQFGQRDRATPSWTSILLEGELKAMLARFFTFAETGEAGTAKESVSAGVKAALRWLNAHFREPEAVAALYRNSSLSRNYLRSIFTEAMQCSPRAYLERIRLRQARFLLRHRDWQLKRVAAECGYRDPLYFSRLYRRFWGHPPSEEYRC